MPLQDLTFIPNAELLQPAEIQSIARAAAEVGLCKIRLTGGEPTLRKDIIEIIARLKDLPGIREVTMTTNGYLLPKLARPMVKAGLDRVNIHIDAVNHQQLIKTMRLAKPDKVWAAITAAENAALTPIKLNVVVVRGFNHTDVAALAELTVRQPWHVRFIELMPLGAPAGIALKNYVSTKETMTRIEDKLGPIFPLNGGALNGEARLYRLPDAEGVLGFISPVSHPYCDDCNRMRITADGKIRLCLLSDKEIDFRETLRGGGTHEDLVALFKIAVANKPWGHKLEEGIHPKIRTMSQIGW
jgi:cyclic pyranopterin phosphate synthase